MNLSRLFSDLNIKYTLQCLYFFKVICANHIITFKYSINNHIQFNWNSF